MHALDVSIAATWTGGYTMDIFVYIVSQRASFVNIFQGILSEYIKVEFEKTEFVDINLYIFVIFMGKRSTTYCP